MPPPRFVTCQICGRGFGSASIGIHVPQCYDKALKRWQLNPVGPKPVMPQMQSGGGGGKARSGKATSSARTSQGLDAVPVGAGGTAARSLKANNVNMYMSEEAAPENANLHPCRKCGRKFNYDRITYHESVCKGDQKRPVFNSTKQRMPEEALEGGGGGGTFGYSSSRGTGKKKVRKAPAAAPVSAPVARYPPAPPSTWRQQHEEFLEAIRNARRADSESKAMWGSPSTGPSQPRGVNKPLPKAVATQRRVPALMTKQDASRKRNMATGGRAAKAQASSISTPAPANGPGAARARKGAPSRSGAFGGGGERVSGGYGGGGGGGGGGGNIRIVNDNTTSLGMKQAFGLA